MPRVLVCPPRYFGVEYVIIKAGGAAKCLTLTLDRQEP